jgi:hypothetical protein
MHHGALVMHVCPYLVDTLVVHAMEVPLLPEGVPSAGGLVCHSLGLFEPLLKINDTPAQGDIVQVRMWHVLLRCRRKLALSLQFVPAHCAFGVLLDPLLRLHIHLPNLHKNTMPSSRPAHFEVHGGTTPLQTFQTLETLGHPKYKQVSAQLTEMELDVVGARCRPNCLCV